MSETPSSTEDFSWFLSDYDINFESLNPQAQAVVRQLGRNGVRALVEQHQNSRVYRGNRISPEEEVSDAERLARLVDTSNKPRFVGPGSRKIQNGPDTWINEEYNDLANPDED